MKQICIITNGYPTKDDPVYAFIQPLVREMADAGHCCTVIAPQSISKRAVSGRHKRPYRWVDKTERGDEIVIYQPEFLSFSNLRLFGLNVSTALRDEAIRKCFQKEQLKPDVFYAHFWDCGIAACKLAQQVHKPVYVATGESRIRALDYYSQKEIARNLPYVKGVIAVSTKNLEESRDLGLLACDPKTVVLPNAVNPREFYPMSKAAARKELGFSDTEKIAIFVGSFCHRKGVLRVVEAVEKVANGKLILIGSGEQQPQSERIVFVGKVSHEKIVTYLNAADVFVLPTLAEGCCNAIVEALACGVPVISSDLPFNYDILNETNSIMVNPENTAEIAEALEQLFSNPAVYETLTVGAGKTGKQLTISHRCESILKMMETDGV